MKKIIIALAVAFFATITGVRADTSYLLIQGPFGSGGATETFDWVVNYQPGDLTTGLDLLTAALTSDELQTSYYAGLGYLVDGFTLGGASVQPGPWDDSTDSGLVWNYYTAGANDGSWSYAANGASSTAISDGSFDGWVYGTVSYADYPVIEAADIAGDNNTPTKANFSDATVITVVPEPGSVALLALGAGGMAMLYKRRRA